MAVLLFLLCLKAVFCFRITCEIFRHFLKLCQNIIFVTKKGTGFGKRPAHGIYYKSPLLLWTLLHLGSESARRSDCLAREKNEASQKKMGDWGEGGLPSFYLFINFFFQFFSRAICRPRTATWTLGTGSFRAIFTLYRIAFSADTKSYKVRHDIVRLPYYGYMTRRFRVQRGAASLRYRKRAEITVFLSEQKPYSVSVWFSYRCKSSSV